MKLVQSSLARAICAILAGVLIVKFREDMVTWLTIGIGVLFFLSGSISCIAYFAQRKHALKMKEEGVTLFDAQGNPIAQSSPTFPIVGIGSMILGVILACMPTTFIQWLTLIFAIIILLGAVNQIAELIIARKYGTVAWAYWVMPIIMFLAAILAIVKPEVIAAAPLFFIGWVMIFYGCVEVLNAFKVHSLRKKAERNNVESTPTTYDEIVEKQ